MVDGCVYCLLCKKLHAEHLASGSHILQTACRGAKRPSNSGGSADGAVSTSCEGWWPRIAL